MLTDNVNVMATNVGARFCVGVYVFLTMVWVDS